MTSDFLKLSELIPNDPWCEKDIGMISDCVVIQCMYCGCNKRDKRTPGKQKHFPVCPWPELFSLAKQMRKEFNVKYGTVSKIRNERFKRNLSRNKLNNF